MKSLYYYDRLKTREREDRFMAEMNAPVAQNGEQDDIETLHWPQPEGWEQYDWTAWYRGDEPDDLGNMAFGYGDTELRAIADLMIRFPREV